MATTQPNTRTWCVYVLQCTTGAGRKTVHVGIALDVHARLTDHQAGRVKATRGRAVVLLGHSHPCSRVTPYAWSTP